MTMTDEVTLPLAVAIDAARKALEGAEQTCRYHGDVPPTKPGGWTGSCDSCEQPARVRKALALLRRALDEPPPTRRYVVDTTRRPHQANGLYRVDGVSALWAPADAEQARALILRELEVRGEVGPFDVVVTVVGGSDAG
jgi:hypothetical protein